MSFFSSLQPESFAVITQDLGRMCRYVKQGEIVPNALLGSGLYEILKENLRNQAVFHGPFIMPSNDSGHVHGPKGITIVKDTLQGHWVILITAHKRSLGQGNIFAPVCHSVHGGSTWADTPPGQVHPPPAMHAGIRLTSGRYASY